MKPVKAAVIFGRDLGLAVDALDFIDTSMHLSHLRVVFLHTFMTDDDMAAELAIIRIGFKVRVAGHI